MQVAALTQGSPKQRRADQDEGEDWPKPVADFRHGKEAEEDGGDERNEVSRRGPAQADVGRPGHDLQTPVQAAVTLQVVVEVVFTCGKARFERFW